MVRKVTDEDRYCETCDGFGHTEKGHARFLARALASLDVDPEDFLELGEDELEDLLDTADLLGTLTLEEQSVVRFEYYENEGDEE